MYTVWYKAQVPALLVGAFRDVPSGKRVWVMAIMDLGSLRGRIAGRRVKLGGYEPR